MVVWSFEYTKLILGGIFIILFSYLAEKKTGWHC